LGERKVEPDAGRILDETFCRLGRSNWKRRSGEAAMHDRPVKPPTPRHVDPGAPHRRVPLDLVVEYLQDLHHGADLRPDAEIFGRRQRLHHQPWRRSRRIAAETHSTLELIRRCEARFHPH
jgi:hypothetical protein